MPHPMEAAVTTIDDFSAAMREAEAVAGVPEGYAVSETGEITPAASPETPAEPSSPARDEQGRFASTQAAEEAAAPVEEPAAEDVPDAAPAAADPDVQAYLDKYGGDPDKALRAAVEAQKLVGRQGSELGELRSVITQLAEIQALQVAQTQQPQPAAQPSYDPTVLDEWLDQNAVAVPQIAIEAAQRGDTVLYNAAMDKWFQYNPRMAAAFEMELRLQASPAQQIAAQQRNQQVIAELAATYEDFPDIIGAAAKDETKIQTVLAGLPQNLKDGFRQGDPAAVKLVTETLYLREKAGSIGRITEAAQKEVAAQQEQARVEKQQAFVGSTAATPPPEAPMTEEERQIAVWNSNGLDWNNAWQGRNTRR